MTFAEIKVDMPVYDRWWPYYIGIVTKKTKSKVVIRWFRQLDNIWQYDKSHCQFLEKLKRT